MDWMMVWVVRSYFSGSTRDRAYMYLQPPHTYIHNQGVGDQAAASGSLIGTASRALACVAGRYAGTNHVRASWVAAEQKHNKGLSLCVRCSALASHLHQCQVADHAPMQHVGAAPNMQQADV
jgi:hypothetical protein